MSEGSRILRGIIEDDHSSLSKVLDDYRYDLTPCEVGTLKGVRKGVALLSGLPGAQSEELLRFPNDVWGMAFDLGSEDLGVILLDQAVELSAGDEVRRSGRILDIPVGDALIGRVISPTGRPLDGKGALRTTARLPVERAAPGIMDRAPVTIPLQTGIKVVDALIPIGRGQRELILGDRQTGKTAVAVDSIINQKETSVICIYCAIGQRSSSVAKIIEDLGRHGAMDYTIVVVANGDTPPGLQYIAPYAATAIGEHFMENGENVLLVYDDLTAHARAYRELSLLLRRPPGREAFPGDIFYIHSRLLERSTHLKKEKGGGSLTSLPIVETQAENMSAYIPTNIISITDGQIYLSPRLFRKGILPAVDVGRSVSRVGGKTQLPTYRSIAGDLRLSYSQFEELEAFSRFGTKLDEETKRTLERGRRVREIFKQERYRPMSASKQIALLIAVNEGLFDVVPPALVGKAQELVAKAVEEKLASVCRRVNAGDNLSEQDRAAIVEEGRRAIEDALDT